MIASNTKGLSTLLLSVLADEGKLRWDQKVTDLYPAFRLGNDEVTRSVLVRHLVCACTGLPRSEEHTSELQSLMRLSYAVFCLKKKNDKHTSSPTLTPSNTHSQSQ